MRNSPVLTALFPQVRQGVLAATLGQPDRWWYPSELADRLGTSPSSLQRELSSLVASGILVHRREGTRAYFKAETQSLVVLGKVMHKYAVYFETCRRKRNTIDYTFSNVATETEAKEILIQASQFYREVEDWITKNHPSLKK